MSTKEAKQLVIKTLYKTIFRALQDLSSEFQRGQNKIIVDREITSLGQDFQPPSKYSKGKSISDHKVLTETVRSQFKQNLRLTDRNKIEDEVDRGFNFFGELNKKVSVLRQMKYDQQSSATTQGIRVDVSSYHEPSERQSSVMFSYHVHISNLNKDKTVQLQNRAWSVLDIEGKAKHIEGPGVLGVQPTLAPGMSHTYRSHVDISTYHGTMFGTYGFIDVVTGETFRAEIAPFGLSSAKRRRDETKAAPLESFREDSPAETSQGDAATSQPAAAGIAPERIGELQKH